MQNLSSQLTNSIDSLNAKMILMQNELSSLKDKNGAISDSLKTLNETLIKADIATTFYDTHLASYLGYISLIIALIAIIGWKSLVNFKLIPIDKKIDDLKDLTIPKLLEDIKKENNTELNKLEENNKAITKTATRAIFWGLSSFQTLYVFQNDYSQAFVYNLRILKTISESYDIVNDSYKEQNKIQATFYNNKLYIKSNLFDYTKIEKFHEEIDSIYDSLINSEIELFANFAKESRKLFYTKINQSSIEMENLQEDEEDFISDDYYFYHEEDDEEATESAYSSSQKADDE